MTGKSAARAAMGKRDANHAELARVYESLGCSVVDTYMVGGGFGDMVIGCVGVTEIAEAKTDEGDLSAAQVSFAMRWRGSKIRVVRTQEDVIAHVKEIRKRIRQERET